MNGHMRLKFEIFEVWSSTEKECRKIELQRELRSEEIFTAWLVRGQGDTEKALKGVGVKLCCDL